MKTKNIFDDTIENCIRRNPYGAMFYQYNKLYKKTFTRIFKKFPGTNKPCCSMKSASKEESPACDKKDASDHDSSNWQQRQI